MTLANRLSASSSNQVLVLEAGNAHIDDPSIDIPGLAGGVLGVSCSLPTCICRHSPESDVAPPLASIYVVVVIAVA